MDLIDQLRIFIGVAHSGGFTAAASRLSVPRPTVSLAVQQLETHLGARLFNRTTRRASLTSDGETLLERASTLVDDAHELEQLFRTEGADLKGRLRVDVPTRIARRVVAPALPAFFARYPHLELELGSSDRAVDLVRESIDCALRVGQMAASSLVARPLGTLRLINCASPAYLVRRGTPASPQDLKQHLAVLYAPPGEPRVAPWEWVADDETQVQRMAGQVTVSDAEACIACCLAGLGLIQIPAFDVKEHLNRGELVEVLHGYPPPGMTVQLVYPYRRQRSRRVQAFGNWLADVLAPIVAPERR